MICVALPILLSGGNNTPQSEQYNAKTYLVNLAWKEKKNIEIDNIKVVFEKKYVYIIRYN